MFDIKEELKKIPNKPGVYIMRDRDNNVLYVGKAVILKNRVKQYFQKNDHIERINQMISKIDHFEYIVTDSEFEALVLECNLIKKYKPKYNVLLKDDKGYPYIEVTLYEKFPRIILARKIEKNGSKYFGPYYSGWTVNTIIATLRKIFPVRMCDKNITGNSKERVCLNYHIGLCSGPCSGNISEEEYSRIIDDVCAFLNGKGENISAKLDIEMHKAAENLNFEIAAKIRDQIKYLDKLKEKQKVATLSVEDFDIAALSKNDVDACVQIFFIRGGKVTGREFFILDGVGQYENSEIMTSFMKQFYSENQFIPAKIYLENEIAEEEHVLLENWLSETSGKKCTILIPQKGEKKKLALMVKENARVTLYNQEQRTNKEVGSDFRILEKLKEILELDNMPFRIEAYDISNTGDSDINASMVVFQNGKPDKKEYKLFKMKEIKSRNDVGSMTETLTRRFNRMNDGDVNFINTPDLILMDGGIGQVNAAKNVLKQFGLEIPVFGMVKDDKHRTRSLLGNNKEFYLSQDLDLWRFVSSIQNEAHRFAVEYNRKLTEKRYKKSVLDDVSGIGNKRRMALLRHFGSLAAIRQASTEDMEKVKGMSKSAAQALYKSLHEGREEQNK